MISFWKQSRPKISSSMNFAVVDLAVVDVEEERAGGGEDAVSFDHAGAEEAEEVVEGVAVAGGAGVLGDDFGAVAAAAEAYAVAGRASRMVLICVRLCRLPVLKGGST